MAQSEGGSRDPLAVAIWRIGGRPPSALPTYMTGGASGCDLTAALDEAVVLAPGDRRLIPTGWAIALVVLLFAIRRIVLGWDVTPYLYVDSFKYLVGAESFAAAKGAFSKRSANGRSFLT